jgi:hypothetical protein
MLTLSSGGDRLGTPSARVFHQPSPSMIDGQQWWSRCVDRLNSCVKFRMNVSGKKLRSFQQLVLIIGLHLMPALFVVVLLPIMATGPPQCSKQSLTVCQQKYTHRCI